MIQKWKRCKPVGSLDASEDLQEMGIIRTYPVEWEVPGFYP